MEAVTCPYCQSKIQINDVEMNDGACPECGAPITGSLLFSDEGASDSAEVEEEEEDETGNRRRPHDDDHDLPGW